MIFGNNKYNILIIYYDAAIGHKENKFMLAFTLYIQFTFISAFKRLWIFTPIQPIKMIGSSFISSKSIDNSYNHSRNYESKLEICSYEL